MLGGAESGQELGQRGQGGRRAQTSRSAGESPGGVVTDRGIQFAARTDAVRMALCHEHLTTVEEE